MTPPRHTDAAIIAGIAAATAVWQSAPSTVYLAERFGYNRRYLLRRLQRMARAGLVERINRTGYGYTWRVKP
jgi:hypothetical protein